MRFGCMFSRAGRPCYLSGAAFPAVAHIEPARLIRRPRTAGWKVNDLDHDNADAVIEGLRLLPSDGGPGLRDQPAVPPSGINLQPCLRPACGGQAGRIGSLVRLHPPLPTHGRSTLSIPPHAEPGHAARDSWGGILPSLASTADLFFGACLKTQFSAVLCLVTY